MKVVKRIQRKVDGGMVYLRVYDDGSCRIRTDHPSNDPAIEVAMMARVMATMRDVFERAGLQPPKYGAITLNDDPPQA